MKKYLGIFLFCSLTLSGFGQQSSEWINVTKQSKGTSFYNFAGGSATSEKVIVAAPQHGGSGGYSANIRTYNEDLSTFEDVPIPENECASFNLLGFSDYVIFNGTMKKYAKGPGSYLIPCGNTIMGLTKNGDVVFEEKFKEEEGVSVTDDASLFFSSDKSKLILVSPCDKKKEEITEPFWRIRVYDEDLNTIWSDSINYKAALGDRIEFYKCGFDFSPSGKFVICLSKADSKAKSIQASADITVYDRPGHILSQESIPLGFGDYFGCKHALIGETLYFCGKTNRNLFSIVKNCEDPGKSLYQEFPLKTLYATYKAEAPELKDELLSPTMVVPMVDGVLYLSNYALSQSSAEIVCNSKCISLIKFGLDGTLQWAKMIRKSCYLPCQNVAFMAYPMDNDLLIFYGDNPLNIISTKPGIVYNRTLWGLGVATVSPDGTIKRILLDDRRESKKDFSLPSMYQLDDRRFAIKATQKIDGKENTFFRIFQF